MNKIGLMGLGVLLHNQKNYTNDIGAIQYASSVKQKKLVLAIFKWNIWSAFVFQKTVGPNIFFKDIHRRLGDHTDEILIWTG